MNPEGVARLFARKGMAEGPFPTHYEAFDNPLGYNPMYPNNKQAVISPVIRILETAKGTQGDPKDYPHVGTTYRLTEHFHYWTKHVQLNNIVQPEQFVEIGEALGKEPGHRNRPPGQGFIQARLRQGGGRGDQAHQAHEDRWQDHPSRGRADSLGLLHDGTQGLSGEQPDSLRG